jgi:phage recombination protein Bet
MATTEKAEKEKQSSMQLIEFTPYGSKDPIQLSIEIVKRLVAVKTKSGKSCSDDDALKFMFMCKARKLNPFEGDAFLIGYDTQTGPSFSLITAHQAFLKRAELHPEFDGMESGTIVLRDNKITDLIGDWHMPNDVILGGWATVYFKNRHYPMTKRLRLARFNKQYGVWREDPAGMIVKCAEADALRSSFPTMLGGMFISEELPPVEAEIVPRAVFDTSEAKAATDGAPAIETVQTEQPRETAGEKVVKKKEPPPGLRRKTQTPAPLTRSTEQSAHEKLAAKLALINITPNEFVTLAINEGWLEAEHGHFESIAVERVNEFMKDDNWSWIMQAIVEGRAKNHSRSTERTDRLL